MTFMSLQEAEE